MIAARPLRMTLLIATLLVAAFAAAPTAAAQDDPDRSCRDVDFQDPCVLICPALEIIATAQGDGSIKVEALVNDTADLFRSEDGATPELVYGFSPTQTVFLDTNTTVGLSYTYYLVVGPSLCAQVEVTSVPFFGSPWAMVAAVGVGGVGYAVLRSRP